MTSPHSTDELSLLAATTSAIARWQHELDTLDRRRASVLQKLDAARALLAVVSEDSDSVEHGDPAEGGDDEGDEAMVTAPPGAEFWEIDPPTSAPLPELAPDAPWVDAVRTWIHSASLGIGYPRLRAMMEKTPGFEDRFRQSEKGYYRAIGALSDRGEIVKYNGRLYSPEALAAYKEKVSRGELQDERPVAGAYSPMGEAILDIVFRHAKDGILGKDILIDLRRDPEFNATLTPHNSGAYNIIARLVKRRQIIRREDGLCFPGPKFPPRDPHSRWLRDTSPQRPDLRVVRAS